MKFSLRTATIAAVTFLAGLATGISSPVLAVEADRGDTSFRRQIAPAPAFPHFGDPLAPAEAAADAAAPAIPAEAVSQFASLDAAVAAQDDGVSDDELNCLAVAVYFESKGEPLSGQLAVADVILNRTRSGRFPRSVCSVLTQPGQFSFVRGGRMPEVDQNRRAWRTAVAVARVASKALWDSPAEGALFFHARHLSPKWGRNRVASIGNHVFYR